MKQYYIYIVTNKTNTVLYIGVTGNLERRILEHKAGKGSIFCRRYRVSKLLYYEMFTDVYEALAREKQLKNFSRARKEKLITESNPLWEELL